MAREFSLTVVAPDKSVVEETVVSVTVPGSEGYFGVQAGHIPLVAALKPGLLEYGQGNQKHHVYVGGGFAEVRPDRVTILADEAERAEVIDAAAAEKALESARRGLRGEGETTSENAVEEIERAIQRLRAARIQK